MNAAYYMLAICAGLGITLQTTLNGQLAKGVGGDSVAAALFSFTAGAVCLGIFSLKRGGIVASLMAIPAQPWWSLLGGLLDDLCISPGKTQFAQGRNIRPLLRGEHALLEAHFHQRFHFRQALQRRFLGVGSLLAVALGRDVAVGQTAVVMGRPH
mgnify:CR=1 FL=1